jgi:hypothetical protein
MQPVTRNIQQEQTRSLPASIRRTYHNMITQVASRIFRESFSEEEMSTEVESEERQSDISSGYMPFSYEREQETEIDEMSTTYSEAATDIEDNSSDH